MLAGSVSKICPAKNHTSGPATAGRNSAPLTRSRNERPANSAGSLIRVVYHRAAPIGAIPPSCVSVALRRAAAKTAAMPS